MDTEKNYFEYLDMLTRKIAEYEDVPADNIFCSGSMDDIIFRAVFAEMPGKAAVSDGLTEAVRALECVGCETAIVSDLCESLPREQSHTDMVILTRSVSSERANKIYDECRRIGARLIIAESHIFIPDKKEILPENVSVIKTFPQFSASSSGSAGYIICRDSDFLEKLKSCGPMRRIDRSALFSLVGLDIEALRRQEKYIIRERGYLAECFERLAVKVYPSSDDFLMIETPLPVCEMLARHNIRTIVSRGNGIYIVPVSNHENNADLIRALTSEISRVLPLNFAARNAY